MLLHSTNVIIFCCVVLVSYFRIMLANMGGAQLWESNSMIACVHLLETSKGHIYPSYSERPLCTFIQGSLEGRFSDMKAKGSDGGNSGRQSIPGTSSSAGNQKEGGAIRRRDVIVLLFMALALYLSMDSAGLVYSLTPCWYYQDQSSASQPGKDPRETPRRIIHPIVTDLDGDGSNEIILVSADGTKLQVLNGEAPSGVGYTDIYSPTVMYSTTLSTSKLNVKTGKAPVVIKTGYVDKYSDTTERQQVVVVLREDWTIVCFDAKLQFLWEKAVGHKIHKLDDSNGLLLSQYSIDDASITIAPLNFKALEGESAAANRAGVGVVVVGASMSRRVPLDEDQKVHIHKGMESAESEDTPTDHHHGKGAKSGEDDSAALEYYAMYALSASSGQVIWAHDGTSSLAGESKNAHLKSLYTSLPQHMFAMDVRDLSFRNMHEHPASQDSTAGAAAAGPAKHTGAKSSDSKTGSGLGWVKNWQIFKQSLVAELPHTWQHTLNGAGMHLAHFQRRHVSGHKATSANANAHVLPASAPSSSKKLPGKQPSPGGPAGTAKTSSKKTLDIPAAGGQRVLFSGVQVPPISLTQAAALPHDAIEHTEYPNVVVAHTKRGVEVVTLTTGAPVAALALSPYNSYADVDGDGIVDQILVLQNSDEANKHEKAHGITARGAEGASHVTPEGRLAHCTMVVLSGLPARHPLFSGQVCKKGHSLQDPMNLNSRSKRMVGEHITLPSRIAAAPPLVLRTLRQRSTTESPVKNIIVAINAGVVTCFTGKGEHLWQIVGAPTWNEQFQYRTVVPFDSDAARADDVGKHDNLHSDILIIGDTAVSLLNRDGYILTSATVPKEPIAMPAIGDFDNDGITDIIIVTKNAVLGYRLEVTRSTRGLLVATVLMCIVAAVSYVSSVKVGFVAATQSRVFSTARSTDDAKFD